MKHPQRRLLLVGLCLLGMSVRVPAQLHTLETEDMRLISYTSMHDFIERHLARCFENSLTFHEAFFHYTPDQRVVVFLHDFSDFHNAGATAVPRNMINIGLAPASYVYDTAPANERMNSTMNHEVVHIVTSDQATSADRFFRTIFFGKVSPTADNPVSMVYSYFTNPRRYSPRWYHEGIATQMETWMAGGLGRAQGAYDEMVFRAMVRDGRRMYDVVGLEAEGTAIDFQVGANSYLYGTRFMSYLLYTYGPDKLIAWVARTEGSSRYFASQFDRVYGASLDEEWERWMSWEHDWQQQNLDSIRLHPTTTDRPISSTALGSVSRAYYDAGRGRMFAAVNYPGQVPHIAAINIADGSITHLCEVKGATLYDVCSLAYDSSRGTLFYTSDNNGWRDLRALDLQTGATTMLSEDARTGDLVFCRADSSIWGIRHFNGISTLVRIPPPYHEWEQVYSWPYGTDLFDIDLSPDGTMLSGALADIRGRHVLVTMPVADLREGRAAIRELYDFESSTPANFVFTRDGTALIGTSYYTGVSNVVRYDLKDKSVRWLSNGETGLFRPIEYTPDSLLAFRYSGDGFVPVAIKSQSYEDVSAIRYLGEAIVRRYPAVGTWVVPPPSPTRINIDSLTTFKGEYHPFTNMQCVSAYPIVEGYKDYTTVGARVDFSDPVMLHVANLTASYAPAPTIPTDERFHASIAYAISSLLFAGSYNGADFYDLFGPTKTSRKGYSLAASYKDYLIYDEPKTLDYAVALSGYAGLDRLPDYQNIGIRYDRFLNLRGQLTYKYLRASLGAVDYEKGIRGQLTLSSNYIRTTHFPRAYATLDLGFPLPLNHSSVWVRGAGGYSVGDNDESLASFYFGGFGNNWVDHREVKRYRDYYSFPGVALNALGGTNFTKAMVEWNLPPLRFGDLGFVSLYSTWARLSVFVAGIATNLDSAPDRLTAATLGAQLDFKLVLFSMMDSTFSFGYARASEEGGHAGNEFMVSLKLLK